MKAKRVILMDEPLSDFYDTKVIPFKALRAYVNGIKPEVLCYDNIAYLKRVFFESEFSLTLSPVDKIESDDVFVSVIRDKAILQWR